jgi:hypothetical protein
VEVLVLLTNVCPVPSPVLCPHCPKVSASRKAHTDHRRSKHGLYYVCISGPLSPYTSLPITRRLTFELDQKHLLRKDKVGGPVICHLCGTLVTCSSVVIKLHYSTNHNLHVKVDIGFPPPNSPGASNVHPPPTPSPSNNASQQEARTKSITGPSQTNSPLEDGLNEKEGEDGWETESGYSDSSEDILEDYEEDLMVPASFSLAIPSPSSLEDDAPIEEDEVAPPEALVIEGPSLTKSVFGSDSKGRHFLEIFGPSLTLPSQVLRHDISLSKSGFAANLDVNAIICLSCSKGVPVDMVVSHLRSYHPGRDPISTLQKQEIANLNLPNGGLRSSRSEKYIQAACQKPVDGLEVLGGYKCPVEDASGWFCSKAFLGKPSFVRHLGGHHLKVKQDPDSCAWEVQTLFSQGNLQVYFAVDSSFSQSDPPPSSAFAEAVTLFHTLPSAQITPPSNDKERESVHWFTHWPDLLEPYCKDDSQADALRALVSFPQADKDPDWLMGVQDHGRRWWTKAEIAHKGCTDRASILLKSHKEYVLSLLR